MKRRLSFVPLSTAIGAAIAFVLSVSTAFAVDNKDELKCQLGTSLELGKFIQSKAKCIENCQKQVFGGSGNPADCVPPYGGSTAGCVTSSEGKAGGAIQSKCNKDCPECYTGGDCMADADAKIADAEAHVETLTADAFCDDSASGDGLTLSEFKCQRTVRKFVTKFAAGKLKCFAKCRKGEIGGNATPGSCTQPTTDTKTQGCISRLESKTAFVIDKKCESTVNPSADKPECGLYPTTDGAGWVALEEGEVDARLPDIFCNDTGATTTTSGATTTTSGATTTTTL